MTLRVIARNDPALRARVVRTQAMVYADGADPCIDRPAHVRAGSGTAWHRGRLVVIQDDANFVALVDPATGRAEAISLPAGEGGLRQFDDLRGNKAFKMDLEACTVVPGDGGNEMLVAFGSGSAALRERVLLMVGDDAAPPLIREAMTFYAGLRAARDFSGSELNVEGAAYRPGKIVLANRGNGAVVDGIRPVNALCEVDWRELESYLMGADHRPPPAPESIVQYELGEIDGSALTFTDIAVAGDALVYTAAAEASPNAVDDGEVAGSAIGVIEGGGTRYAVLEDAAGARFDGKVEGVALGTRPGTLLVVVDRDDPRVPSELCEVELSGPWPEAVMAPRLLSAH